MQQQQSDSNDDDDDEDHDSASIGLQVCVGNLLAESSIWGVVVDRWLLSVVRVNRLLLLLSVVVCLCIGTSVVK